MNEQSRRQFIRSSAAALGATGVLRAGIGRQMGAAQEAGEIPDYAEWIPDGETVLNEQGELVVGTYTFDALVELFGEVSAGDQRPLQFEPFLYTASMIRIWPILTRIDLADQILGSLNESGSAAEVDRSEIPADRHILLGRTSVYTGSFDTDAIAQTVEESDAQETEFDGVYEYDNTAVIAWGDGYFIQGNTQGVDQVAAIRNTGDGDRQPRHDSNDEFQQLLGAVDHSTQTLIRRTDDDTLSTDRYSGSIDHSPLAGATSYIGTLSYDVDTTEFDATTVIRYPDQGSIDPDQISEMVTNERSQEITRDGRTVRVTARYASEDVDFDVSNDQNGANNTDQDSENSSDGSGPGFGLVTGLSAVGGAGYLLSQRLGDER